MLALSARSVARRMCIRARLSLALAACPPQRGTLAVRPLVLEESP